MKFSLKVLETEKEIEKAVLKALLDDASKIMATASKRLTKKLPIIIETAITSQPEYSSLTGGILKDQFGLTNPTTKIDSLLDIWSNINVTYKKPTISASQIKSNLSIVAIKSDYSDALASAAAEQVTKKGQSLQWLDWLLNQGDRIIIKEYELVSGKGRAGNVVMRKNVKGKWGVPSQFAGSPNNNWITRAIQSVSSIIDRTLAEALR